MRCAELCRSFGPPSFGIIQIAVPGEWAGGPAVLEEGSRGGGGASAATCRYQQLLFEDTAMS